MKNLIGILCLALTMSVLSNNVYSQRQRKLNVVTSTLEAADFAKQIGGDKVNVHSIYHGQFDFHFFSPRPSEVMKLKRADMLVIYGLGHDGWLPALVNAARNPDILFGRKGYVDMSDGIHALHVPTGGIDGRMGHVHPHGACGYQFDLNNLKIAIENIYEGLVRIAPAHEEYFRKNKNAYLVRVEETFGRLKEKMEPFRGTRIVQFHESWFYFANTFGLEIVGSLEPKPGIPPSPAHLSRLIRLMEEEDVKIILAEPFYPRRPIRFVSERTGAKEVTAAMHTGGIKGITTFLECLEHTVSAIVAALKK